MSDPTRTTPNLSESEYLRREAERARHNAGVAWQNAKAALGHKLDPRDITRKHPVLAIVGAVAGGFVAAAVAIPSKEEQELHRLERLHRATHPPQPAPATNGSARPPAAKPTFWAIIVKEVIGLLKPILVAAITAGIKAPPTPASDPSPPQPR